MIAGTGLIAIMIVASLLLWILSRVDRNIDDEGYDNGPVDGEADRIVTQITAAQRLRREAAETTDPEKRARLIMFAEEAEGTVMKLRQGLLSDR